MMITPIGTKLYRYVQPFILQYSITGIRTYEDGEYYEARCDSCKHGSNCEVLLTINDYGRMMFVKMLNYDEHDDQRCWHNDSAILHLREEDAKKEQLIKRRKIVEADLSDLEKRKKSLESNLDDIKIALELLEVNNDAQT